MIFWGHLASHHPMRTCPAARPSALMTPNLLVFDNESPHGDEWQPKPSSYQFSE